MSSNKFLTIASDGTRTLLQAINSSSGAGDAAKIICTDAGGKIDATFMPSGVGAETAVYNASEDLAANDMVNIWDDAGTIKVRKADGSTTGKYISGYVTGVVTTGNPATVYLTEGTLTGMSGLTQGAIHYLSDSTAGGVTATAPADTGETVQVAGFAVSTTELLFDPGEVYEIDLS